MRSLAKAQFRQQPQAKAPRHYKFPSDFRAKRQRQWRENQKDDVHGEDIEQRRPVDKARAQQDGVLRPDCEVVVEKVMNARMVAAGSERADWKRKEQQTNVVNVQAKGAQSKTTIHGTITVALGEENIDSPGKHRREHDETL